MSCLCIHVHASELTKQLVRIKREAREAREAAESAAALMAGLHIAPPTPQQLHEGALTDHKVHRMGHHMT